MLEWVVSGSVLIAVVIALRFALKGKVSLRLQYAMWALVLVRLLIPVGIGAAPFGVAALMQKAAGLQDVGVEKGSCAGGADVPSRPHGGGAGGRAASTGRRERPSGGGAWAAGRLGKPVS